MPFDDDDIDSIPIVQLSLDFSAPAPSKRKAPRPRPPTPPPVHIDVDGELPEGALVEPLVELAPAPEPESVEEKAEIETKADEGTVLKVVKKKRKDPSAKPKKKKAVDPALEA